MKKLSVALVLFIATAVFAGAQGNAPVTITKNSDGSGTATGSMYSARSSSNAIEVIGCQVYNGTDAVCLAQDKDRKIALATSTNVKYLETLRAMTDYSYISFSWNASGQITSLTIMNASSYLP